MQYDLAIVGDGVVGSTLGMTLAAHGAHVVIIEKQTTFRNRNRSEVTHPWGVAKTIALGVYQPLLQTCAHETRYAAAPWRDLIATIPWRVGRLNFYHPAMQQTLLDLAVRAGAEVRRPAEVLSVEPGEPPAVQIRWREHQERITARLVVGADGRESRAPHWAGFLVQRDPDCKMIAGTLYHGLNLPDDTFRSYRNPYNQQHGVIIPIGHGRFRVHFIYHCGTRASLSGQKGEAAFIAARGSAGGSSEWFEDAERMGLWQHLTAQTAG
jgi:menaquinone-9 beta-reductase